MKPVLLLVSCVTLITACDNFGSSTSTEARELDLQGNVIVPTATPTSEIPSSSATVVYDTMEPTATDPTQIRL